MIIQAIVVAVSFGRRDLGGHSLKRGALTTGMERGVVSPSLKRLGRHKSFRVWLLWPVSRNHPPPRGEAGWAARESDGAFRSIWEARFGCVVALRAASRSRQTRTEGGNLCRKWREGGRVPVPHIAR
jgi:hypothetical protein